MSPNFEVALRYCGVLLLIYIIWGGYVISGENLMSQVPWFGWISVCSQAAVPNMANKEIVLTSYNLYV